MPIGFVKGKTYMLDKRYDHYAGMDVFKDIVRTATKLGFGSHIYYSCMTRTYCCELRKHNERFTHSAHAYYVTAGHKYADTPLEALLLAVEQCIPLDLQFRKLLLLGHLVLLEETIGHTKRITSLLTELDVLLAQVRVEPVEEDDEPYAAVPPKKVGYDEDDDL